MIEDWFIPKELPADQALQRLSEQYHEVDPSAVHAVLTLLRVAVELHSASEHHFGRYKLSKGRFVVLIMLHAAPDGEMYCSDIAQSIGVTRATMTGLLDGLERDGLIRRLGDPEDRRRTTIALTADGRRLLNDMLPDHFRRIAGLMANLSEDDRGKLLELLNKVRSGLPALQKS